jgi:hypothetical protein
MNLPAHPAASIPTAAFVALLLAAFTVLALASATSACKKSGPPSDTLPFDDVSRDDVLREQKRVAKGEQVGDTLENPQLELDARGVTINGHLVPTVPSLDAGPGARFEAVSLRLRGLREHWEQIYWSSPPDPFATLTVAPDVSAPVVEGVLASLATSGYTRVHVVVGATDWAALLWVGEPPGEEIPDVTFANVTVARGGDGYDVSRTVWGRSCVHTASPGHDDTLRAALAATCPPVTRCLVSVVPSAEPFGNVAAVLAGAFGRGGPPNAVLNVHFDRAEDAPCSWRPGVLGQVAMDAGGWAPTLVP